MDFEWNPQKAELNIQKHGVCLEEAASVFGDYFSWAYPDVAHSINELRYITVGLSDKIACLLLSIPSAVKLSALFSARPATRRERNYYESQR